MFRVFRSSIRRTSYEARCVCRGARIRARPSGAAITAAPQLPQKPSASGIRRRSAAVGYSSLRPPQAGHAVQVSLNFPCL